jgi:hypothetical protein
MQEQPRPLLSPGHMLDSFKKPLTTRTPAFNHKTYKKAIGNMEA